MSFAKWETIKTFEISQSLKELCDLCKQFERHYGFLVTNVPVIDKSSFGKTQTLAIQILSNYLGIIQPHCLREKDIKETRDAVQKVLSHLYDDKGRIRIQITEFYTARANNNLDIFITAYFAPFIGFIDSKIYDAIREATALVDETLEKEFTKKTTAKLDVFPEFKAKKGEKEVAVDLKTGKEVEVEEP